MDVNKTENFMSASVIVNRLLFNSESEGKLGRYFRHFKTVSMWSNYGKGKK